ncbi:MAG TPA: SIMPL domain-containing protein [Candidatus Limnocylindrales bacterium]|nr:SIMPL domain-containing protein [Candidatus Limnocylindrales bacterium]
MTAGARRPAVTVSGTGSAGRPADLARATFTAEAIRESAAEARSVAAASAAGVIAAVRRAGVADADLHTAGLDVTPNWEHDGTRMVRNGFTVTNRIAVTIRDLESVGRVLDAGLEAGATGLDGVSFLLADEAPAAEEARRAAVSDARSRAATIADAAGCRLGALVSISEGVASVPGPFPAPRMMAMAADAAPTPVLPGRIDVTVSVTAEWEIDPAG